MAYNSGSRSERLLQGRRFTTDGLTLTQEAFADVFDLGANEIFTDDGLIPTGSSQLPYSGSSQDGLIISASLVNPSTYTEGSEDDLQIVKYHYRKKLKGAADATREIYYFTTSEPSTHDDYVEDDQRIEADQETNFISPKYIIPGHASRNAESITPGYKIAISYGNDENNVTAATDDQFVFDYKTGVLTWVGTPPHDGNDFVFATTYQYVGRTLRSQIDDGSIGGSDFTAAGISGSTRIYISGSDDGFELSNDSTLNFVSGTAGVTVLSNGSDTITIGANTDNVTFNEVNASIINADRIEASEYIVSSSITYMTQSFSSGSTIFGDGIDDTHLFTGSLKLTGSLIADIATTSGERTPLVIDEDGNITVGDDYVTDGDIGAYDLDISSSGDNNGITITDAEVLIISGAGGLDVTSDTNTLTFTIGNGILSSSAQIKDEISGSFTETSASIASDIATNLSSITDLQSDSSSFSTRVTTNETDIAALQTDSGSFSTRITTLEGNEVHTAAAISGSTRIYVSGSNSGFDIGQDSTLNFVSGTAGVTVLSNGSDTITIGVSTDDVEFNSVTADTLTGTASFAEKVALTAVSTAVDRPVIVGSSVYSNDPDGTLAYNDGTSNLTFDSQGGKLKVVSNSDTNSYLQLERKAIKVGDAAFISDFTLLSGLNNQLETIYFGESVGKVFIGNKSSGQTIINHDLHISGSDLVQVDDTTLNLFNTNTTTLNFGGAATTINMGAANGTVTIAGSASIAGDLIVQGTTTSIQTENLNVSDQFILLASGSTGTSDGGIIVQSGSNGVGTALYFDANSDRWAVNPSNTVNWNDTSLTPKQYVVSVSASADAPPATPSDFGVTSEYYGMMHVNTGNGDIYIYS